MSQYKINSSMDFADFVKNKNITKKRRKKWRIQIA